MMVRVRQKCGGPDLFFQRFSRIVLAALVFVAHDRHFGATVVFPQAQIAHAIRLQSDGQREILRTNCFVIIRPVQIGGSIRVSARPLEQLIESRAGLFVVFSRAFEHEVLEQMSCAGCSIRFVS